MQLNLFEPSQRAQRKFQKLFDSKRFLKKLRQNKN
jgi:hypothetical protein